MVKKIMMCNRKDCEVHEKLCPHKTQHKLIKENVLERDCIVTRPERCLVIDKYCVCVEIKNKTRYKMISEE